MSDDVKPYTTAAELDATEKAINQLVRDESVEDAANALDGISRRLLATARAGLAGPSQSELDAWRKRATEAETEAAEYRRILYEAHDAALNSPAVNSADAHDPRLHELRTLATQFASVRESVMMGIGATRSGQRRNDSEANS